MTSAFIDQPSAQRWVLSGCSGSLPGFIVDAAQCGATICSFTSTLGGCHFDAPTAVGNHQDGFLTDVSIHARHLRFGVMPDLGSRVEPLRVPQHAVDRSTQASPRCEVSLLYALMIWGIRYEGYNPVSQVPSELTAIGAPTQRLWTLLGPIYTLLVAAFGWGIWRSAGQNRAVRIVGGLILAYASLGLLWPFAPMHQREVLAAGGGTLSDTMHVVLGGVTVFLMFLAIGFGATAFGKPFRLFSIATTVVLLTFGALTFFEAPRLQANQPTPWIGLWERINISVFLLWVVILGAVLRRTTTPRGQTPLVSPISVQDSGG